MIRRKNAHDGDSPVVAWWVRDWLTSRAVLTMPRAARSLYFDLLLRQSIDGSLPPDTKALASLTGETHASFLKLWRHCSKCFEKGEDGQLRNPRMEKERRADEEYRTAKADAGAKGAAKRWQNHASANGSAMRSAIDPPIANGSPSSSSSSAISSPTESAGVEPPPAVEAPPKPKRAEPTGPQAECAAHWRAEWTRTRAGTRCGTLDKGAYVLIAWMLENADPENVRRRMTAILEDPEDFVHRKASLKLLRAQWDNYALTAAKPVKAPTPPDFDDVRARWTRKHVRKIPNPTGMPGTVEVVDAWPGYEAAKHELNGAVA